MSRIAKAPIIVPKGVSVEISGQDVKVKGTRGNLSWRVHPKVGIVQDKGEIKVHPLNETKESRALAGTTRALVNNMVIGCGTGFERKLTLVGIGYRAQAKGKVVNLNLGFSHPIDYPVPEGVQITTPSPTEIIVAGADKQLVGQVASEIRGFRPPEPYKGKGVRYADERVRRKEAKK